MSSQTEYSFRFINKSTINKTVDYNYCLKSNIYLPDRFDRGSNRASLAELEGSPQSCHTIGVTRRRWR